MIVRATPRSISVPHIDSPKIDGRIERLEWHNIPRDSGFIQIEPNKGELTSQKTYVRVGMDSRNLYVAFECLNRDIGALSAGNRRRDQGSLAREDGVALLLDTFHDGRSAYLFHVNLLNTQTDWRIEHDGGSLDDNWDTEWRSAVQIEAKGWYAEVAIPFKSVKFSGGDDTWGVNFVRSIARNNEIAWWSGVLEDNYRVSDAGDLIFDQPPKGKHSAVWIPYTSLYRENGEQLHTAFGLDAEIPITSDLAGNLTINPDFASVEGDQEEINLDPWEIEYPEKRPFFRDVNALFELRYNVFYSRRIGDISHGEKLYGKIGGLQVAGIYARTRALKDQETGALEFPKANFTVLRIQKDILSSSTVGITAVEKRWTDGSNRVLNLDTEMRLPFHLYASGQLFFTTPGKELMKQSGGFIRLARETNVYHYHLRLSSLGSRLKENMNTTGYLSYDDVIELDAAVEYTFRPGNRIIKQINYDSNYRVDWSQRRVLGRYEIEQELKTYFRNRFSIEADCIYDYRSIFWRRDGQTFAVNKALGINLGYNKLEWSQAELGYEFGQTFDGVFDEWSAFVRFKPLHVISLSYELESRRYNPDRSDIIARNVDLHILSSDLYFKSNLFIKVFCQYRSDKERLYFYGVFGYRYRPPDSAVYVTYSYDQIEDELNMGSVSDHRILFLKISHALRWW